MKQQKEPLKVCAWCTMVQQVDGSWKLDPEALAAAEADLDEEGLPKVSHGICPDCDAKSFVVCPLCETLCDKQKKHCARCGAVLEVR